MDQTSGLVHVPVDASPDHVYTWLEVSPHEPHTPSTLLCMLQHVRQDPPTEVTPAAQVLRQGSADAWPVAESGCVLSECAEHLQPAFTIQHAISDQKFPQHALCAVQKHAAAAATAARQQFADKSKLDDLTDRTWRRLRMRSLSRHPDLGREQFQAACLRLLAASKDLALIFDGLKIQLGLANQVSADGDVIEVAWNFEV